MRRTKIVATLGPASESPKAIRAIIEAGVDVVRLNQSHGSREWHERAFAAVRTAARAARKPVAILVDMQGPKVRIGRVANGRIELAAGDAVDVMGGDGVGDAHTLYTPLPQLVEDVKPGDSIVLDDGNLALKVLSKKPGRARCVVTVGGTLTDHKGMNLPGVALNIPSVTEADLEALRWAARAGAEYVAVSFVRSPDDIAKVRASLDRLKSPMRIIAKIEKPEALARLDEIARLSDGLMVARGDLGVEMPLEEVPVAQERIIAVAHKNDIPVIVATQMLESMRENPRPTRAEVSDVANAIFGTTDAVMLSGETAAGKYPVAAVREMASIARAAEAHMVEAGRMKPVFALSSEYAVADAVCHGAYSAAEDLSASAVLVATASGRTALLFSKYRFPGPLICVSDDAAAVRRMALYWGARPMKVNRVLSHSRLLAEVVRVALSRRCVARGDTVVFVAGTPMGKSGATNLSMVHRIPGKPGAAGSRAKA